MSVENTAPTAPVTAPGHRFASTGMLFLSTLIVTVVRCVPIGEDNAQAFTIPAPDSLTAVALEIDEDLWAIWNTVANMAAADELFDGRCAALYFDPPVPMPTEGGCGGWTIPFRAAIGGYR